MCERKNDNNADCRLLALFSGGDGHSAGEREKEAKKRAMCLWIIYKKKYDFYKCCRVQTYKPTVSNHVTMPRPTKS